MTGPLNPVELLSRHYEPGSGLYRLLLIHSVLVARKAREIALDYLARHPGASLDLEFLTEAALLHDIGIRHCRAPKILCEGTEPYLCHGFRGREMLEGEGLPRHALVCERHIGVGITAAEVASDSLPIPPRDYLPVSLEEKVICLADKFYSKDPEKLWVEKDLATIRKGLAKWGPKVLERWKRLSGEILGTAGEEE